MGCNQSNAIVQISVDSTMEQCNKYSSIHVGVVIRIISTSKDGRCLYASFNEKLKTVLEVLGKLSYDDKLKLLSLEVIQDADKNSWLHVIGTDGNCDGMSGYVNINDTDMLPYFDVDSNLLDVNAKYIPFSTPSKSICLLINTSVPIHACFNGTTVSVCFGKLTTKDKVSLLDWSVFTNNTAYHKIIFVRVTTGTYKNRSGWINLNATNLLTQLQLANQLIYCENKQFFNLHISDIDSINNTYSNTKNTNNTTECYSPTFKSKSSSQIMHTPDSNNNDITIPHNSDEEEEIDVKQLILRVQ